MGDQARARSRGAPLSRVGATAPGKALLCGEYAVLEGAPAVVAAVDRRVCVTWSDEPAAMPPEVEAALTRAKSACGPVPGSLLLDASALRRDRVKLGLGSSAAGAAAAAAAVFATRGHDLSDSAVRQRVFDCAFEGHAAVAPEGSGVDVAASTFGGFLRFRRDEGRIETRPLELPRGLVIRLVWTGQAARTSDLVAKVRALQESDPRRFERHLAELTALAAAFADAFERKSADDVVRAGAEYGSSMGALGDAAGAPIVEARLERAAALAAGFSGSAKPCGAGGGDVAIAFFLDDDAAESFSLACGAEGLHPIDVSWGAAGVEAC